jgi:prevent-host-death family protein
MTTITVEEAQAKLPEVIDRLRPGEELEITRNNRTVAKLVGGRPVRPPREPGNCKGILTIISDDDEHLRDWAEYMP